MNTENGSPVNQEENEGEGNPDETPQPVMFIAEIETFSMLMQYQKIITGMTESLNNGAEYLEREYGVHYPFNYIIVVLSTVVSMYVANQLRNMMCRKKKQDPHVFNTIDSVDMAKLMRILENLDKKSNAHPVETDHVRQLWLSSPDWIV